MISLWSLPKSSSLGLALPSYLAKLQPCAVPGAGAGGGVCGPGRDAIRWDEPPRLKTHTSLPRPNPAPDPRPGVRGSNFLGSHARPARAQTAASASTPGRRNLPGLGVGVGLCRDAAKSALGSRAPPPPPEPRCVLRKPRLGPARLGPAARGCPSVAAARAESRARPRPGAGNSRSETSALCARTSRAPETAEVRPRRCVHRSRTPEIAEVRSQRRARARTGWRK